MLIQTCNIASRLSDPLKKIYLRCNRIDYVDSFKYLGHYNAEFLLDGMDINREIKSLYSKGNLLFRFKSYSAFC